MEGSYFPPHTVEVSSFNGKSWLTRLRVSPCEAPCSIITRLRLASKRVTILWCLEKTTVFSVTEIPGEVCGVGAGRGPGAEPPGRGSAG